MLQLIEKRAIDLGISRNTLIKEVLENYAERISENKAAETIHTQIDALILNQNRLIEATNNSATNISKALQESMELSNEILEEFKIAKTRNK
ncbi:hypothetical protein IV73_GL001052 [Weissella kandleri]|uniref:Ribbon-helix-helix protein CopG domain-containing protein n=2 Tax=Weissella kandleri TaxID=1616 RepID=A0A0R2JBU7_9LACO|nr:hypothetical protein IV73_GL001052 [Weissella kandleri]